MVVLEEWIDNKDRDEIKDESKIKSRQRFKSGDIKEESLEIDEENRVLKTGFKKFDSKGAVQF